MLSLLQRAEAVFQDSLLELRAPERLYVKRERLRRAANEIAEGRHCFPWHGALRKESQDALRMLALDVAAFAALQAKGLTDLEADLCRVHAQRYPDLGRAIEPVDFNDMVRLFAHDRSYPEHHLARRYLEALASQPRYPIWPSANNCSVAA